MCPVVSEDTVPSCCLLRCCWPPALQTEVMYLQAAVLGRYGIHQPKRFPAKGIWDSITRLHTHMFLWPDSQQGRAFLINWNLMKLEEQLWVNSSFWELMPEMKREVASLVPVLDPLWFPLFNFLSLLGFFKETQSHKTSQTNQHPQNTQQRSRKRSQHLEQTLKSLSYLQMVEFPPVDICLCFRSLSWVQQ